MCETFEPIEISVVYFDNTDIVTSSWGNTGGSDQGQ